MLVKIELERFRCFKKASISFKDLTVIVGKNNAGKSSIIEALRMISLAGKKAEKANYVKADFDIDAPFGFKLDVSGLKIDLQSAVYLYQDDAKITAIFENKRRIELYIKNNKTFACLYDGDEKLITSKTKAQQCGFNKLSILPQIGLIKENEKMLKQETVISDQDTYLSSRHFRNELFLFKDKFFKDFKNLSEKSWSGLKIQELSFDSENNNINLIVKDLNFTTEIGFLGSGLKMWLQIIWFICRTQKDDIIILDEPDVYMHPDLQRKILQMLVPYTQVIIATHSVEIISEVEPHNIVMVDKTNKEMVYANSSKGVQKIINTIGSIHNLALVRIANLKKIVFVEGDDMKILALLYKKLYPKSDFSFSIIPSKKIGGKARLKETYVTSELFHDESGGEIKSFCLLDRDYSFEEEITEIKEEAIKHNLQLHIWKRKEIENYLLVPDMLFRISKKPDTDKNAFLHKLEEIVNDLKDDICDQYSERFKQKNRDKNIQTCNKQAREYVNSNWKTLTNKLKIVSGKDVISKINNSMGLSCSINKMINNLKYDEIDEEVKHVITMIVDN